MRRYSQRASNERGNREDPKHCIAEVHNQNFIRGMVSYQCSRKRGHGPGGLYCSQHAKKIAEGQHVRAPDEE